MNDTKPRNRIRPTISESKRERDKFDAALDAMSDKLMKAYLIAVAAGCAGFAAGALL